MEPEAAHPAPSRPFGLACALVGVDPSLMATCPPRDHDGVRLLCALMILVWVWQSAVFAAVAHLMLAAPGVLRLDLVMGAVLLATIILLIDAYVVMRPSWTDFGYEELRRGGLDIPVPALARVKGVVFLTLRLALSAVIGTLVALFVSLILYGKDIAGQLATEHVARNAPVIAAATRLVDERLARHASTQADLRARIAAADRAADGLRGRLVERVDPATISAAAELDRAERVRGRAEAEVARQQRRGDAPSLARAQRRLDATTAERDAARAHLGEAEGRAVSLAQGRDTVLTGQLAALDAQRRQDFERLAVSEAEQRTILSERPAATQAAVAADPAYAAPDDGLLASLRALKALTADPWVGAVVLLLEVFFAGIELAAVFAKLLSFVPTTYATRLAREDRLRQVETAREIAGTLEVSMLSTADSAKCGYRDVPGTLTATGMLTPTEPADRSLASLAADEPDQTGSAGSSSSPAENLQEPWASEATVEPSDEKRSFEGELEKPLPRRRRGRPSKAR